VTTSREANEETIADNQRLEIKITKLTYLVRQLAIGQHHTSPLVRVCGICASTEHPINSCLTWQETDSSVKNNSSPFLEDLVKQMTMNNIQFQQNVIATIQDL
ncbi:hypothetical protein CR513_08235, partial [Mucuna pruriens]